MKQLIFSFLFLFIISGCYHENKPEVKIPVRLLPEDTFIMMMTELEITEGTIKYNKEHHIRKGNNEEILYSYIYKKFNLTPVTLKENIDYYNSDPDNMINIYDKVLAKLTEIQTELEIQKKEREQYLKDSIASIDTTHLVYKDVKPYKRKQNKQENVWPTIW